MSVPSYAIVIPSVRRLQTDYLADTVRHLAERLAPEQERLHSIIVYRPDPPDSGEHPGVEEIRRAKENHEYGLLGERVLLRQAGDLPEHQASQLSAQRTVSVKQHCQDIAFALSFAATSGADRMILLEDDVRVAQNFLSKTERIFSLAQRRHPQPAFVSLFSWDYGPPGTWFRYHAYSQALAFACASDASAAMKHMLAFDKPRGADHALSKWDFSGRRGMNKYPSLVQHIGDVSAIFDARARPLVAPTFRADGLTPLDAVTMTVRWLWRVVRRRIGGNITP